MPNPIATNQIVAQSTLSTTPMTWYQDRLHAFYVDANWSVALVAFFEQQGTWMMSLLLHLCPLLPPPVLLPLHFLSFANLMLVGVTEASDRQTGGKPVMNFVKFLFSPKTIFKKHDLRS